MRPLRKQDKPGQLAFPQKWFHSGEEVNSCLKHNVVLSLSFAPARKRGIRLPANTVEGMTDIIIVDQPGSLTTFLGKFAEYMHVIA